MSSYKLLTWAIGFDKQQLLANTLFRGVSEPDWVLAKQYYYRPVVTYRRGEGL